MSDRRLANLPPLNALRAFEASSRHLNFRLAAEELGVTQGAVAQQVRGLEASLKVKLFERLPRSLALSEEGRAYLPSVRRAFELIADATQNLKPQTASLTISVTPSFAAKWLIPRLGQFTEAHPDLDVRVVATDGLSNFQSDGVDIAVRYGQPPFGPGLTVDLLFSLDFHSVCSPALLAGAHPLRTPDDLRHHMLLHDTHGLWPEYLEGLTGEGRVLATRGLKFSLSSLAIDAAVAGQGVALASDVLAGPDLAAGRLVRPFDLSIRGLASFYIVAPRKRRRAEAIERMREWLLAQAG